MSIFHFIIAKIRLIIQIIIQFYSNSEMKEKNDNEIRKYYISLIIVVSFTDFDYSFLITDFLQIFFLSIIDTIELKMEYSWSPKSPLDNTSIYSFTPEPDDIQVFFCFVVISLLY